jgi:hypothetical protein
LTIHYEDIGSSFDDVMKKCFEFIGGRYRKKYSSADINITEKIALEQREVKI